MKNIFIIFLFLTTEQFGITRYVSQTGMGIPPYTSWETAGSDLQKVIDFCTAHDTIVIDKGEYGGEFVTRTPLTILGVSRDSTILFFIDNELLGRENTVLYAEDTLTVKNLTLTGNDEVVYCLIGQNTTTDNIKLWIEDCKIFSEKGGVLVYTGSAEIRRNYISSRALGSIDIESEGWLYHDAVIENNVIVSKNRAMDVGVHHTLIRNNLFKLATNALGGHLFFPWSRDYAEITNNIFQITDLSGLKFDNTDTVIIKNNTFIPGYRFFVLMDGHGISINRSEVTDISNNLFYLVERGISKFNAENPVISEHNLFYKMTYKNINGNVQYGEGNIIERDPMFYKENFTEQDTWDTHLQYGSPAIDSGNPDIFDIDGTRSDIGAFGGPGGINYLYRDLPPKEVTLDTLIYRADSGHLTMKWYPNGEGDLSGYKIYRSSKEAFEISESNLITFISDTSYSSILGDVQPGSYYYKIEAVDSSGQGSGADSYFELVASDTVVTNKNIQPEEYDYMLEQNYPNPFNPSTRIGYSLKEEGHVKIKIYDTNGQYIETIKNIREEEGRYEVEFDGSNLASGIYIYRIEVSNDKRVPVFLDMGKMVLVK